MTKSAVDQVVQRAISDAAFRRQLQREPQKALAGLTLTADERSAITSGDPIRLTALGVDQRMSKAFGLGAIGDVSKTVAGDATGSGSAAFADELGSTGNAGLVSPDAATGNAALIGTSGTAGKAAFDGGSGTAGTRGIVGDPALGRDSAVDATTSQRIARVEADLDSPDMRGSVDASTSQRIARVEADLDSPNMRGTSTAGDGNAFDAGVTGGAGTSASTSVDASTSQRIARVEADLDSPDMRGSVDASTSQRIARVEADLDSPDMRTAFEPANASGAGGTDSYTDALGNPIDPSYTSIDGQHDAAVTGTDDTDTTGDGNVIQP